MKTKLIMAVMAVAALSSLTGCRHKDLMYDVPVHTSLRVVFDWRYAPDASPESMGLGMHDTECGQYLRYTFPGRDGGTTHIPFGSYTGVCFSDDNTDWAYFAHPDDTDLFEISTADAEVLPASRLGARSLPRAAGTEGERMAATPQMLWTDRVDGIILPVTMGDTTITLYPEERVCHYTVDIYDVDNFDALTGLHIDATISGMAEGFHPGREQASDTPATMTFVLEARDSSRSLHAEFLTFGETPATERSHTMSIYLVDDATGDGYHCTADVTAQVADAPDPHHVHIVLRYIDIPVPRQGGGGLIPDVEDWQSVVVDLEM